VGGTEAEKYDNGLVESWKGDMEGMLNFLNVPGCNFEGMKLIYPW
jgi:hypothetical protein